MGSFSTTHRSEMMDSTEVRAPQLWRRPHAKIYGFNQDFSANYYSPMLEYVQAKNRQGIFFSRPTERISLPDGAELVMRKPRNDNKISSVSIRLGYFPRPIIQSTSK